MLAKTSSNTSAAQVPLPESVTASVEMTENAPVFNAQIIDWCKTNWPHLSDEAFEITDIQGGSYNRVVGFKVDDWNIKLPWFQQQADQFLQHICQDPRRKGKVREYVIRMPRHKHSWFQQEVAIMLYLAKSSIPTPVIKSLDLTTDNPLGSHFTVQPRLPGRPANKLYLGLNTSQRISFARDLGRALKEMQKLTYPCPGTLDPDSLLKGSPDIQILRLQCPPRSARYSASTEEPTISVPMSVYDFIKSQLTRQHAYDMSLNRRDLNPWKQFSPIIDSLHGMGFFKDNSYYLTHMDFEPRNILINNTSSLSASLSGILDWDESIFAPAFLNCKPPSWLWDFEGMHLDEGVANVTPNNPDLKAIKQAFDGAAGKEYCRYAYTAEYRLARDIARLAVVGICYDEDYEIAEEMLRRWNGMYPGKAVGGMEEYDE